MFLVGYLFFINFYNKYYGNIKIYNKITFILSQ